MDLHRNNSNYLGSNTSPSSSSSTPSTAPKPPAAVAAASDDPMHSWWESISKARSRIHALSSILPPSDFLSLSSLADSDRPALSLLSSSETYSAISSAFTATLSGSGSDPLCQWLYDTYLSSDPQLRLVVLSYLPLLAGLYLTRIHSDPSPSLAGFEAVLLAIYNAEVKARSGKPITISIPDLSQPSLYHTPRNKPPPLGSNQSSSVGIICPPLEAQVAVKSTQRAMIVGIALYCFYRQIFQMPAWSKLDICRFAANWAGQDCPCRKEFDSEDESDEQPQGKENSPHEIEVDADDVVEEFGRLKFSQNGNDGIVETKGARIPLPWELLEPVLRILAHCLLAPLNSQEVISAASIAVRSLYARASHDLVPQAILATRSLIQADKRARADAKAAEAAAAAAANPSSNTNTPRKAKPEVLLVSK
ncbi:hypothetical protein SAY87_001249 [Trapa incisa]|uniref:Hyccin n=1 Tax=Trapa incisa TaxID=236973 RepID=A0AAN7GFV5_9MYRT|nr:hypothetical protein SAY87_001249 [Trapa incisa]